MVGEFERFARQVVLKEWGKEGQERLSKSKVAIVGLGALGSLQAELLVRAGVGNLVLIDRDVVEISNLQRQHMYTSDDVGLLKVEAASRHLKSIWPEVSITSHAVDLSHDNVDVLRGVDVILDGTDNWPTRWLLNDFAVKEGVPLIYGAAVRTEGLVMPVIPKLGPCLACVFPPPNEDEVDTCDRVGVLNTVTTLVATLQTQMALHILLRWDFEFRLYRVDMRGLNVQPYEVHRREDCPVCVRGRFEALKGAYRSRTLHMCGRDVYQINPSRKRRLDLLRLASTLLSHGDVNLMEKALQFRIHDTEMLVFPDGRALVRAPNITRDKALMLYRRWIGE